MKHVVAIALLGLFSTISFAQSRDHFGRLTVPDAQDCPASTTPMAYYTFQDGMFMRRGWICEQRVESRS
jgi:hypothetical protein